MNITGIPKANDSSIVATQKNNAVEKFIRAALNELRVFLKSKPRHLWEALLDEWIDKIKAWLESCGGVSAAMLAEGFGKMPGEIIVNGLNVQLDDFIMNHLNNPKNDSIYSSGDTFDNRSIYNLRTMFKKLGFKTLIIKDPSFVQMREHYKKGRGAVLHRKGHYMAGIGYEAETRSNVHHDPLGRPYVRLNIQAWQEIEWVDALIVWLET